MKKFIWLVISLVAVLPLSGQNRNVNKVFMPDKRVESRQEIIIPNINGYQVVKCDFHMHTVFSDGIVWPTFRVQEAWRDGLDAIAITDHIEYLPHKEYLNSDFNTSYQIAESTAEKYGIIFIKGAEITRKQGVIGHFNALFIKDANSINDEDPFIAIQNARKMGAFILFNHPGWAVDTCKITEFQQRLFDNNMIDGIEVFNHFEFYPRVVSWCIDMKFPMFANSDEHGIISEDYRSFGHDAKFERHRPITLVLAKEKTEESIKEALLSKRTIAYSDNTFAGTSEMLIALFKSCVIIKSVGTSGKNNVYTYTNNSSLPFVITVNNSAKKEIPPHSTIIVNVTKEKQSKIVLHNMWCYENKHPEFSL